MKLRVRDGGDVQRQWTATEIPRMRHDLVEHARGDLDRLAHPGVRDVLRRERVGQLNEFTKKPVTDEMFEAELAGQIDRTRRDLERYRESELFWVTRDMTRVAMDASTDIPAWIPATTVPAATGLLIWAEPLPRLCWYGTKQLPYVTADAVQWVHDGGFVDIDILTRTDQLVAEGHLDKPGRRGPFAKVRGVVLRADEPTPVDKYVVAAEPGLIAALGATWTLMQIPTVATPRQITGAGGSGGNGKTSNAPFRSLICVASNTAIQVPLTVPAVPTGTVGTSAATAPHRPTALDTHCLDPPGYPATSKARPAHRCSSWNESTSGAAEAHEADTPHVPPLGATSRQRPGIRPVCV